VPISVSKAADDLARVSRSEGSNDSRSSIVRSSCEVGMLVHKLARSSARS
jgi:hypothetical protein